MFEYCIKSAHSKKNSQCMFSSIVIKISESFGMFLIVGAFCFISFASSCLHSPTEISGTKSSVKICSGKLLFEDNFDRLDETKWKHEKTLAGGGNWEFQWYVNDRTNTYTDKGLLHIKPSLTSDIYGEKFLKSGRVTIPAEECTQSDFYGCERQGSPDHIINPIRSARISTVESFSFKFGTLEIRAKMPAGDWLWPALWLVPKQKVYGEWPRSGEIDLMEMRGNRKLFDGNVNVGVEQAGSTLHFGPQWDINGWDKAHYVKNKLPPYNEDFHIYKMIWTPNKIQFLIDNETVGTVHAGNGFWNRGKFQSSGLPNPWSSGTIMAPFDQEFYIIMNLAVGGTKYFADSFVNRDHPKPW